MPHCLKTELSILLNTQCNLRCKYCYVGEKSDCTMPSVIDFNFVKRAILDYFENFKSKQIRFFSVGEPTMAFPMMKKIKEWVDEVTNGECKFELQTNGKLFYQAKNRHNL